MATIVTNIKAIDDASLVKQIVPVLSDNNQNCFIDKKYEISWQVNTEGQVVDTAPLATNVKINLPSLCRRSGSWMGFIRDFNVPVIWIEYVNPNENLIGNQTNKLIRFEVTRESLKVYGRMPVIETTIPITIDGNIVELEVNGYIEYSTSTNYLQVITEEKVSHSGIHYKIIGFEVSGYKSDDGNSISQQLDIVK